MFCPKCGHERTSTDDPGISEDQCPACGIYYFKYINQKDNALKPKPQNHKKPAKTTKEVRRKSLRILSMRIKLFITYMLRQIHHIWDSVTQKIPFVLRQTQHVWNKVIKSPVVVASLVISSLMFGLFWVVAPANMKDKVVGLITFASAERQCFNYHKENYFKDPDSAYIENSFIRTKIEEAEINPLAIFEKFDSYVMVNVQAKNSMGGYGPELIKCPLVDNRFDRAVALSYDMLQRANDLFNQDKYAEALPFFQSSAEQGNAEAQYKLGLMYNVGKGVTKDYTQAVYWLKKAAEQGIAHAQVVLGVRYELGNGVAKNDTQAVHWYKKAAEQGNAEAQYKLGFMYSMGNGVAKDDTQAFYWYKKAAEQDNADAQLFLGFSYTLGNGVAKDDTQAFYWYKKAAQNGNADAQTVYLKLLKEKEDMLQRANDLFKQNRYAEVLPLYQHLAEQGNAVVQNNLGNMLLLGYGVAEDKTQAFYWHKKAAEQGLAAAQGSLGFMYSEGQGVAKDNKQAIYWYKKAAEQGDRHSQYKLGFMYQEGQGVEKDNSQAVYWYKKAAEQGLAGAQNNLGSMYHFGKGVALDYTQAIYWYKIAAEQGLAEAQSNLGFMYSEGKGVEKDKSQAIDWYKKAAKQGLAEAIAVLKKLK